MHQAVCSRSSRRLLAPLLVLCVLSAVAVAQNRNHPGLVHLGDGEWGTTNEARALGMFEYHGRWYPKKLRKKIEKWERQDAKGLTWDDAYKAKTKSYRVETNVPRFVFELEIAPFLDALYETYVEVFERDFGLAGKAAKNKTIKIYDGFEDYAILEGGVTPRSINNPGFIVNGTDLVVYYEESDPARFYATVFHEGAHQFFLSLLPGADLPIWLDEALATYFEGCTYSRATQTIEPSFVSPTRLTLAQLQLKESQASPEELFLNVPQTSFRAQHYALAWSFLHYLIHRPGEDNAEKFARFLREMNGSGVKPVAEVFEETTKENFGELQSSWRAYVLSLKADEEIHWIDLSVADAQPQEDVRTGDLIWSLNGIEIYSSRTFYEAWNKRPRDRLAELVLIRISDGPAGKGTRRETVRAAIAGDSKIKLLPRSSISRSANLSD